MGKAYEARLLSSGVVNPCRGTARRCEAPGAALPGRSSQLAAVARTSEATVRGAL